MAVVDIAAQLQANSPERVHQTFNTAGQVGRQAADRTRQALESERAAMAGRRFAGRHERKHRRSAPLINRRDGNGESVAAI